MALEAVNNPHRPSLSDSFAGSQTRALIRPQAKHTLTHENRVLLFSLAAGLPAILLFALLLWMGGYEDTTRWSLLLLVVSVWLGFAFAVRSTVIRPLQTLANMQSALREGDFSFRVRGARWGDALGELMLEVNAMSDMLREQRLGAVEANALLTSVMTEIEVAVFAFDGGHRLRLVNRAGERLLAQNAERLLGKRAEELDLGECLEGEAARTLQKNFPAQSGRWAVRRSVFRQGGIPHHLVVFTDLSRALREEERQAWLRLVRVLGHELNNSLAPICSIAGSLKDMLKREIRAADWEDDLARGLKVIVDRSEALSRFMKDYARLTRLPKPQLHWVPFDQLVRTAVGLETRLAVEILPSPQIQIQADPDQIQQLLINVIRNAVDASKETGGKVTIGWTRNGRMLEAVIRDEGPGIANPANLFVPFFTTKPGGSGIGLALSRQIAEGHGGTLTLSNAKTGKGCEARLELPLAGPAQ